MKARTTLFGVKLVSIFLILGFVSNLNGQQWRSKISTTFNIGYGLQDNYLNLGVDQTTAKHYSVGAQVKYYPNAKVESFSIPLLDRTNIFFRLSVHGCNFFKWEKLDIYGGINYNLNNLGLHLNASYFILEKVAVYVEGFRGLKSIENELGGVTPSKSELQMGIRLTPGRSLNKMNDRNFRN